MRLVLTVVISLVSALETLEIRTEYPRISPFLVSGAGCCHEREMVVTPVPTTVKVCGAPDGTVQRRAIVKRQLIN